MPIFCSKRRPELPIIGITPTASIYRRLSLHFAIHPVLSYGLKVATKSGTVSRLLNVEGEVPPSHEGATGPLRNTDAILALAERDVMESPAAKLANLKFGDSVCYCAGYNGILPGLSNTVKMSRFGDAIRSEKARVNWPAVATKVLRFSKFVK
ncbi:hypothetical protein HDU98_007678 [Podochytrium sp. JEL0797]|nr:hypothetical protein HDU98_007678 [Podochytrium sp. JEL0797]